MNYLKSRLPQQMQRAMAAEAEATREARAKVNSLFPLTIRNNPILLLSVSLCPIYFLTKARNKYITVLKCTCLL